MLIIKAIVNRINLSYGLLQREGDFVLGAYTYVLMAASLNLSTCKARLSEAEQIQQTPLEVYTILPQT
ncbi:MAG: hypothetical protein QXN08_02020 [Nitrososphaerales archaeon]